MEKTYIKTTCKVGACEPQCGLMVEIEDGVLQAVQPDVSHPISQGYMCLKANAVPEYQNDPDRLLFPERGTAGGRGRLSWHEATTEIGQKLREITDKYGPSAVATYWGNAADTTGMVAANTLCSGLGSPNSFNVLSLEYTDRGAVAERVLGDQTLILQPDADNTHFALLLGTNPLVTQGMTLLQRRPRIGIDLKKVSQRGGKVVVVDPRVTETTRSSDLHVMIKPGTDLFLLLAIIHRILITHQYDSDFLARYTTGKEQWLEVVKELDLQWAAETTGITVETITQIADEFSHAKSAFATTRVGVQTSHNTTLTEWAVLTLNTITGNIDRPGGVFLNPGAIDNTRLIHTFTKRKNPANSRIGGYPQIFGGPPATVFSDDVLSEDTDRIRALIVVAGNPVMSFPDTQKIEKALKRLDLLVCIDIYRSDTGSFAHYNLPAATIYEKGGLHVLTQPFEPYPFAEWRKKVVEPRGEARPEWDIARDIARAAKIPFLNNPVIDGLDKIMGWFGKHFTEKHFAQLLFLSSLARKKISINRLINSDEGIKFGDIEWGAFLNNGLLTADKKIHLAPSDLMQGLKEAISAPPTTSDEFPLMLISGGRRLASFNSWTHNLPSLAKKVKGNHAVMSSADAEGLDIQDGSKIRIVSATNAICLQVEVSEEIRQGVIVVHQFWGHHYNSSQTLARKNPGVNVNLLHSDKIRDQFCGMPVFNGTPCRVEMAELVRVRET
jgi:anaerobic selenocysteine-containing dehydrogenase